MLKIPDKEIKYNEIIVTYELLIRQNYPFLDYILKNSELINSFADFFKVLSFANELFLEVQNIYERKDTDRPLREFMKKLFDKKQESLHEVLKKPQEAVDAWNRLATRLGILQNDCTIVGYMDKEYSLDTPAKAFLLDKSTKENPFGLFISSLFHNFAKIHNELMTLLNARKNQIPEYRWLNLYNEFKKVHPQQLNKDDVFMITEKELIEKLFENSISSISYGRNFVFNNFDSYQEFFVMKLLGKCEIISIIEKFKSVCYNGEAFSEAAESSGVIADVRGYFYEMLTPTEVRIVKRSIQEAGDLKERHKFVVEMRGDLERIMITVRNLNGVVEARNLGDFIEKCKIDVVNSVLKFDMGGMEMAKIVNLYETIEE